MANQPTFVTIGKPTDNIGVRLSYKIIELFSQNLYASPNKAIEELVANSFDAGALRVQVLLSANLHEQKATIAVIDDGERGMSSRQMHRIRMMMRENARAAEESGQHHVAARGIRGAGWKQRDFIPQKTRVGRGLASLEMTCGRGGLERVHC